MGCHNGGDGSYAGSVNEVATIMNFLLFHHCVQFVGTCWISLNLK